MHDLSVRARLGALLHVATAKHGVLSREELLTQGLTSTALHDLTTVGLLHRLHDGVYALPGAASTWGRFADERGGVRG